MCPEGPVASLTFPNVPDIGSAQRMMHAMYAKASVDTSQGASAAGSGTGGTIARGFGGTGADTASGTVSKGGGPGGTDDLRGGTSWPSRPLRAQVAHLSAASVQLLSRVHDAVSPSFVQLMRVRAVGACLQGWRAVYACVHAIVMDSRHAQSLSPILCS